MVWSMWLLEWNDLNSWCKEWILDDVIEFDKKIDEYEYIIVNDEKQFDDIA